MTCLFSLFEAHSAMFQYSFYSEGAIYQSYLTHNSVLFIPKSIGLQGDLH